MIYEASFLSKMRISRFVQQIARFKAGDFVKETRKFTQLELDNFSKLTGDNNSIHKRSDENQRPLVHGAFLNSIVAGIIGTKFPGEGTIVVSQNFEFPSKCYVEDPVVVHIELLEVRKIVKVKYEITQEESTVFRGEAKLLMNKL